MNMQDLGKERYIGLNQAWQFQVASSFLKAEISLRNSNYFAYRIFLDIEKYFIGLYNETTKNKDFNKIKNEFFSTLWKNGELFISKVKGNYILYEIHKIKRDKNNQIIYVEGMKIKKYDSNFQGNLQRLYQGINGNYVQWDVHILGAYFEWWWFCVKLSEWIKAWDISVIFDAKRFKRIRNNNNEAIIEQENKSIMDIQNPFIEQVSPLSDEKNRGSIASNIIQPFELGESKSKVMYENINNFIAFIFNFKGLAVPMILKKERKNLSESMVDIYNTLIIERNTLHYLNSWAEDNKKYCGDNLKFDLSFKLNDVKDEEEKSIEKKETENE